MPRMTGGDAIVDSLLRHGIDTIFGLPGLGKYAVDALSRQDLPQVMGVTMVAAFFVVLANLGVDLLYGVVDPSVRVS